MKKTARSITAFSAFKTAAVEIVKHETARYGSQSAAAEKMQEAASQVSLLITGKLHGFSAERCARDVANLGYDIDITIKPAKGSKGKVSVSKTLKPLPKEK